MEGKVFIFMVLSGLCTLSSCLPPQYHFIRESKTWTEAQSYCRQRYTDLATVTSEEDMAKLIDTTGSHETLWIGLYDDVDSWRWSLQNETHYGEGQADFRKWSPNEPSNDKGYGNCVKIYSSGNWSDDVCSETCKFICYDARLPSRFILVDDPKNWAEAQSYCRQKHTDLASVRNSAENEEIQRLLSSEAPAWIGLFRDSWKWSDGNALSFTKWGVYQPNGGNEFCVVTQGGGWHDYGCYEKFYFACYSATTMQVVRLRLTKPDSSVDLEDEDVKEALLQQMRQKLKDQGLSGDIQLRWVTQPDGKVFHLEENEDEDEENCSIN